jgi:hypothetical protein
VLGLTATATREMQNALCSLLSVPQGGIVRTQLLRSNLHLSVSRGSWRDGLEGIEELCRVLSQLYAQGGGGVIVYCSLQRTCDRVCQALLSQGFQVGAHEIASMRLWFVVQHAICATALAMPCSHRVSRSASTCAQKFMTALLVCHSIGHDCDNVCWGCR